MRFILTFIYLFNQLTFINHLHVLDIIKCWLYGNEQNRQGPALLEEVNEKQILGYEQCCESKNNHKHILGMFLILRIFCPYKK